MTCASQDSLGPVKVHSTSTVASSDVKLLTIDSKDLERTLAASDFENLKKLVHVTEKWRKSHVEKAMNTVNATQEIAANPDANIKAHLRESVLVDRKNKQHSTFNLGEHVPST